MHFKLFNMITTVLTSKFRLIWLSSLGDMDKIDDTLSKIANYKCIKKATQICYSELC